MLPSVKKALKRGKIISADWGGILHRKSIGPCSVSVCVCERERGRERERARERESERQRHRERQRPRQHIGGQWKRFVENRCIVFRKLELKCVFVCQNGGASAPFKGCVSGRGRVNSTHCCRGMLAPPACDAKRGSRSVQERGMSRAVQISLLGRKGQKRGISLYASNCPRDCRHRHAHSEHHFPAPSFKICQNWSRH